jgi:tetratricopeptide (TPR) repeat protein
MKVFFNIKRIFLIITGVMIVLSVGTLQGEQPQDGGTESLFSFYGAGARAISLGGANVAKPAESTALFWNPAFLDHVRRMQVGVFHTSFFGGTPYNFVSFTFPTLRMGTFSGGFMRIATGDIQYYDYRGVPGEIFSFSQEEFLIGYGKQVLEKGSVGLLLKIEHQSMLNNSTTGIGLDAGFSYDLPYEIKTGFVLRNLISPSLKLLQATNTYPASIVIGMSRDFLLSPTHMITPLFDIERMGFHSLRTRLGVEYSYLPYLSVRGGFNQSSTSFGFGVKLRETLGFDYAVSDNDLLTQHLFSVNYSFGLSKEEKLEQEKEREEELIEQEIKESFEARRRVEIDKHIKQALQLFEAGDYFASLTEWQQVLAWDENNERAKDAIEQITATLDEIQEERNVDALTKATSKELFDVGIRYYTEKRYSEAISSWERVLEIDPENELSSDYLDKARQEVRNLVANHAHKANRLIQAGDYTGALNEYHISLRYDPQNVAVLRGIKRAQNLIRSNESFREGLTHYLSGDFQAAVDDFKQAMKLNPKSMMVEDYIADAESRLGGGKEGTELQPEFEKEYLRGIDLYLQGQYQQAIEVWENILEHDPYNQSVIRNIQAARERLKTIEELGTRE